MRSDYYVYFWTNPYIKLYTLCMADIVMLLILACVDRLARWRVIAWDQAQHRGKGKKRGTARKNGERNESRDGQFAHRFFRLFSPLFYG